VRAATVDETLYLSIRDDGIGGADPRNGSGIIGLKDRVDVLGGAMTVNSPVGGGTVIEVTIPLAMPPREFHEGRQSTETSPKGRGTVGPAVRKVTGAA
jgi:glucose-6-phosphate-specific signal transduction histidine kinase